MISSEKSILLYRNISSEWAAASAAAAAAAPAQTKTTGY